MRAAPLHIQPKTLVAWWARQLIAPRCVPPQSIIQDMHSRKALDALRPTFGRVLGNAHLGDSSLLGIKERVTINKGETS